MPPDPHRLGVLRTPSLSTFINHRASKGPLLVKKNPPFKIPGYGPEVTNIFLRPCYCLYSGHFCYNQNRALS